MLVSIDTIKCFSGKLGKKYHLQKRPEAQHDSAPSSEESVNEAVQAVITQENDLPTQDPSHSVTA